MSRKSYIDNMTDPNFPLIKLEIEGWLYSFTVKDFPSENHLWLLDVIESQMQLVHDRATRTAQKEIRDGIKQLLGL